MENNGLFFDTVEVFINEIKKYKYTAIIFGNPLLHCIGLNYVSANRCR